MPSITYFPNANSIDQVIKANTLQKDAARRMIEIIERFEGCNDPDSFTLPQLKTLFAGMKVKLEGFLQDKNDFNADEWPGKIQAFIKQANQRPDGSERTKRFLQTILFFLVPAAGAARGAFFPVWKMLPG